MTSKVRAPHRRLTFLPPLSPDDKARALPLTPSLPPHPLEPLPFSLASLPPRLLPSLSPLSLLSSSPPSRLSPYPPPPRPHRVGLQVGVLQNLAAFLRAMPAAARLAYLPILSELRAETDNWRFRQLLAHQLADFGSLFPRRTTAATMLSLAYALATDAVAEVRIAAIAQVGALMCNLTAPDTDGACGEDADGGGGEGANGTSDGGEGASSDGGGEGANGTSDGGEGASSDGGGEGANGATVVGDAVTEFVGRVCVLLRAPSCYKRANGVQLCGAVVGALPAETSASTLLPVLRPLTRDRVANVRLALAQCVKQRLLGTGSDAGDSDAGDSEAGEGGGGGGAASGARLAAYPLATHPLVLEMAAELCEDSDRDVLRAIHPAGYEPPPYKSKSPSRISRQALEGGRWADDESEETSLARELMGLGMGGADADAEEEAPPLLTEDSLPGALRLAGAPEEEEEGGVDAGVDWVGGGGGAEAHEGE